MPPQSSIAPRLPRELLDKVQDSPASKRSAIRSHPTSRKEGRKLERLQRKSQPREPPRNNSFRPRSTSSRNSLALQENSPAKTAPKAKPSSFLIAVDGPRSKSRSQQDEAEVQPTEKVPSKRTRERLEEDDAQIAALERKLGIKGRKTLPKAFKDEGLDMVLAGLESDNESDVEAQDERDATWLKHKRRKLANSGLYGALEESSDDNLEDDSEDEGLAGLDQDEDDSLLSDQNAETNDFEDFVSEDESTSPKKTRENPYVAPGSENPTDSKKYIPPSLRTYSGDAESTSRLKRQMKGLLNRLSEANLLSILKDIEKLYQSESRQIVTSMLAELLINLIYDAAKLSDTFIILHAGFVAAIYKSVGSHLAANLVERIVKKFDDVEQRQDVGKGVLNLMSFLTRLYVFQIIGSTLIFDYIRVLLRVLSEDHTEILLRIVKDAGPQLRHDDPSSLKDIVLILYRSVNEVGESNLSVRTKFMIETLNDLKNNRMKTGIGASAVVSEHTTSMKKTLGTLNNRTVQSREPLRASLADIRSSDKRGKWWEIGASWTGDEKSIRPAQYSEGHGDEDADAGFAEPIDIDGTADLMQVAREQRMNTDIRRAVFISIMSASDYKDAHLRLLKLRLKRSQEPEISRVLLHCAAAEDKYNPYYTLIARKLCSSRKLRKSFQFALWDLFKRMGERGGFGEAAEEEDDDVGSVTALRYASIVNLAKLYANLILSSVLGLEILKAADLLYLQPKTKLFVEVLLITILLRCQSKKQGGSSIETIFETGKQIHGLTKGLQYFLRKVVARTDLLSDEAEAQVVRSGCKTAVRALMDNAAVG